MSQINDFKDILREIGRVEDEILLFWGEGLNKRERYLNACAKIEAITQAYNEGRRVDFDNREQRKYYLYFEKRNGEWVLHVVFDCRYCACLGFGCYFLSEADARDAYAKFKDVWDDFLP